MCAPLVIAFSNFSTTWLANLLYNLGRILTYTSMGLTVGLIGRAIIFSTWQPYIAALIGLLMIIIGIFSINLDTAVARLPFVAFFFQHINQKIAHVLRNPKLPNYLLLGILNGFLPCGIVYVGLLNAVATGEILEGGSYMMSFGLGTLPIMASTFAFGNRISQKIKQKARKIYPLVFILMGLWLIHKGYQHYQALQENPNNIENCH
jgi:uncharacterized protein